MIWAIYSWAVLAIQYPQQQVLRLHADCTFVIEYDDTWLQEGVSDPPSISSISRLLRGGSRDLDGKKDYSIDGILGGKRIPT